MSRWLKMHLRRRPTNPFTRNFLMFRPFGRGITYQVVTWSLSFLSEIRKNFLVHSKTHFLSHLSRIWAIRIWLRAAGLSGIGKQIIQITCFKKRVIRITFFVMVRSVNRLNCYMNLDHQLHWARSSSFMGQPYK